MLYFDYFLFASILFKASSSSNSAFLYAETSSDLTELTALVKAATRLSGPVLVGMPVAEPDTRALNILSANTRENTPQS